MKKVVAIVVVALLVVVGAGPWFMGRVAHSRVDKGLDKLVEQVPYFRIAERKWNAGWFRSDSTVTFEFVLPGVGNKPVAALADATPAEELIPDIEPEDELTYETGEEPVDEPAPQAIPKFPTMPPLRFTMKSQVLHGPVLGTAGIGVARVETKLVLSEEIRSKLIEVLGTDEPVRIRTRLAFLGGGTTTISGDARTIPLEKFGVPKANGTIAWDAFSLSLGSGRKGSSFDIQGRQPRIEFKSDNGAEHLLLSDLTVEGNGSRITEDLYDGNMAFGIGKVSVASRKSPAVDVSQVAYNVGSVSKGDYFDYAIRMGSGEVKSAALESLKFQLKEVHYDMTLRHLHTPTLQKLTRSLRDSYSKAMDNPRDAEAAMMAPLAEHGRELLKHDPEFVIDRIGIVTEVGEAVFKGVIKLPGVTDNDLEAGVMALMPRLVADITFEAPQALFEKVPNGNMIMGMGIDQGYVTRKDGKVSSHIEFRDGKLTVNGKSPQVPPIFGGRPPQAPPEVELPVPPPAE